MPFTIRPSRRLPVQCTVTYNAALSMVNSQPASLTEVEEPVRSMFLDRSGLCLRLASKHDARAACSGAGVCFVYFVRRIK